MMPDRYEALRLRNQLCFPLYLCAKELTLRYQPLLDKLNLTYTQYVVMMCLWETGEASAKALSRTLLLDPSTLTPVLKKLEQKGYVVRARDPGDERSLIVRLTDAGKALRDAAMEIPGKMGGCLGLTAEEAAALGALLGKILNNMEKER